MPRSDTQFKKGNSGRLKGSKNKSARLKAQIVDAIELAAKKYGKNTTAEEYLAILCKADPMNFLRIAASLLPKDLKLGSDEGLRIILEKADPEVEAP